VSHEPIGTVKSYKVAEPVDGTGVSPDGSTQFGTPGVLICRRQRAAPTAAAVSGINATRFDANGSASDGPPEVWHAITAKTRRNANEVDASAWCAKFRPGCSASFTCVHLTPASR